MMEEDRFDKRDRLPWLIILSFVFKYLAVWFTAFMSLVGIWTIADDLGFQKLDETPRRWIYIVLAVITVLALLFTILRYHLVGFEQRSFRAKLEYNLVKQSLGGARRISWIASSRNYYLRLVFARWRIQNSIASLDHIIGGTTFLPVRERNEYLISVFQNLVELLSEGMAEWKARGRSVPLVRYDTLSSLDFWDAVLTSGSRFLDVMKVAKSNGLVFRRFILINIDLIESNRTYRNRIREILNKLRIARQKEPVSMRELILQFAICDIDDFRKVHEVRWPFAVIHMPEAGRSERMAVIPNYLPQVSHFDRIDVYFDKGEDHSRVKRYVNAVEKIANEHTCYDPSALELYLNELDREEDRMIPDEPLM